MELLTAIPCTLNAAEIGDRVTTQGGFYGFGQIEVVVAVQPVALTENVTHVHPPLIRMDVRGR